MNVLERAILFATGKHEGQVRKFSATPYILHPLEVASIVGTMDADLDLLAAAVLHDTVEDTDTTLDEIKENFGTNVYLLVLTETEDKREDKPAAETWELRKEESLIILGSTKDIRVKKLWMGDKLSNVRSFAREYRAQGDAMWNVMNQKDPQKQAWYYFTIAKYLSDLKNYDAYIEYVSLIKYIFKDYIGGLDSDLQQI